MSPAAPVHVDRGSSEPLQRQLRRGLIGAIHAGRLRPGQRMLSSRAMAEQLGLARNTVTAVYDELIARGYLETLPRRGCFVAVQTPVDTPATPPADSLDWQERLRLFPSAYKHIDKPRDWRSARYPFIFGEVDRSLFPVEAWRDALRHTLGREALDWWSADQAVEDDPMLVEQIRSRILPERGIYARPEEILVTFGAQQGFYLLARLLSGPGRRVGCEMPGYPDSRFIFSASGAEIAPLTVDGEGARIPPGAGLDLAVLTPGAHCPSLTVMSEARRAEILDVAQRDDILIVEDDHDGLVTLSGKPSLKSQDRAGRVIHLGSLSKVLAPGVRLGYMVAPEPVVREARWLRRLIHRFMPLNNQRTAAVFLAEGHFLALTRNLRASHAERWSAARDALPGALPGFRPPEPFHGGPSLWLECPPGMDAHALRRAAWDHGVAVEDGDPFVPPALAGRFIRLGLSVIPTADIAPGLAALGAAAASLPAGPTDPPPLDRVPPAPRR